MAILRRKDSASGCWLEGRGGGGGGEKKGGEGEVLGKGIRALREEERMRCDGRQIGRQDGRGV